MLGCYVDDLFTLYSHDDEHSLYHSFTQALQTRWGVEDEGEVTDLLNVEISREDDCVVLRQTGYIERLVSTYLPQGVPVSVQCNQTPCDDTLPQLISDAVASKSTPDPAILAEYQSIVGALNYCATHTRPDVAYSVGMLSRAMAYPTPELLARAQRVLAYLYRTRDLGLRYEGDSLPLDGFSDSDWAVKHSTSGFVFRYCKAAISWGSKKQKSVALSSCEAEIVAASEAAKEAVYFSRFLTELGFGSGDPTALSVDNKAARDLAYNPEHHERTKHIDRRHFYIRELVEEQMITVPYVNTVDNIADFFTKALSPKIFIPMRNKIMNVKC